MQEQTVFGSGGELGVYPSVCVEDGIDEESGLGQVRESSGHDWHLDLATAEGQTAQNQVQGARQKYIPGQKPSRSLALQLYHHLLIGRLRT